LPGWPGACLLVLLLPSVQAQTIADYSRAQRALLENTMTQAAARSAGMSASAPSPSSVAPPPAAAAPAIPASRIALTALVPTVQVSGVFAARDGAIAEVVVNATPYLLAAGQGVPGTTWHVEAIDIDRVVLSRRGATVAAADAQAARKVFTLPALPTPR
jgi:type IV pilus biogenesis protein PilP